MPMPKRCRRACPTSDGETTQPLPLPVPLDILLEILARSDARTLLRCAATSRAVRRVVLGPDFRRRLALRAETAGSFEPALLVGVSYLLLTDTTAIRGDHLRFDAGLFLSHKLVDSRDGFVVLQKRRSLVDTGELRVCDSLTGETYRLPPAALADGYPHALLTVGYDRDGGGRPFQLLAADRDLRTQTFSSAGGRWGPVVQTRYVSHSQQPYYAHPSYTSRPIVLGSSTIHWLCLRTMGFGYRDDPYVIALDVGSARAARIDLPPECVNRMRLVQNAAGGLQLATSPTGSLAVLVAEILVISMWTLPEAQDSNQLSPTTPAWTRQVVIKRQAIRMVTGPITHHIRFLGFGQRSGAVLLEMDAVGLVQLNLGSKDAVVLSDEIDKETGSFKCTQLCLHEINLSSLLQAMGPLQQYEPFEYMSQPENPLRRVL